MVRSQKPRKGIVAPVGKTGTLHAFFDTTSRLRAPPAPTEAIIIVSDDENSEIRSTQPKRKSMNDSAPESFPSGSKKGKHSPTTAQFTAEHESPPTLVPPSSLNRTNMTTGVGLYAQPNHTQQTLNLIGDWEMGDDEFLDRVDDSRVTDNEESSPGNALDTCPVCGAIFVDFCLSVSTGPSLLLMGPYLSHRHPATSNTHQCLC